VISLFALDGSLDLTASWFAIASLVVFCGAYGLVVLEDVIHLKKSKPVLFGAGVIWVFVALAVSEWIHGPGFDRTLLEARVGGALDDPHRAIESLVGHHVAEYGALFLFLMVAMTYISAITERNVFLWLNAWLVSTGWGLRAVFWMTGLLAFWISPVADNMTTALLMGAVVTTVGRGHARFISLACANIVVAANAGGAFSPFGDITTLMVWQANKVPTLEFLKLVPPSIVNWLVPAALMHFAVPKSRPEPTREEVQLKEGWWIVILLFLATIVTAVLFHMFLHLPPFLGMTTGLGYLMGYNWLRIRASRRTKRTNDFDVFKHVADVEWDTLLFFFGVIMCVGGLNELGYLAVASNFLYQDLGAFQANVGVGLISAVVDNVPVMFAVLNMDPSMSLNEWLLVTLTTGVGGSMLSVGSAAGVALMGTAHGRYTFTSHLKWTPAIALGYAASIGTHVLVNGI
jgi:Na+/H+ antiporter NhaD/arsenite permease-like protein